MPIYSNIPVAPGSDFSIQTTLVPVTPIGGWNIVLTVTNRLYGISGLIVSSINSGFIGNSSGGNVINSGNGIFSFRVSGGQISGWAGTYPFIIERRGSGSQTLLSAGYLIVNY